MFAHDPATLAFDPEVVAQAKQVRPGLLVWAAARGKVGAVATLVTLGFDVDAKARADVPIEQEWETALRAAVANGDEDLVVQLLASGADPTIRDHALRHDAAPGGRGMAAAPSCSMSWVTFTPEPS